MNQNNKEIEVRFLNVNDKGLKQKLKKLGAKDFGEDFLTEIIFYDKELQWLKAEKKFIRLRKTKRNVILTYKNHWEDSATGTEEIEFEVSDLKKAIALLESIGFIAWRYQEKKRHSFQFNNSVCDFDYWPNVPCCLEIEGHSEEELKEIAKVLELDWNSAIFENQRKMLEKYYNIPVADLRYFTFDKIE